MNKRYDLVSIIRPALDEPSIDSIHKEISDIIETSGGEVLEQGVWQRKKLAYEIDGNKEGIYTISLTPDSIVNTIYAIHKIEQEQKWNFY